jgi:hypothetical protein
MADLVADSASMGEAAQLIATIAGGTVDAGAVAVSAMGTAVGAITHPHLQSAVDSAQTAASQAHQALGSGIAALGSFATNSASSIEDADRGLGQAIAGAME